VRLWPRGPTRRPRLASCRISNHVQIFENRGAMMGASNPHPHCQIWATEHVPDEPLRELSAQQEYADEHHRCLLCDYAATELAQAERVVAETAILSAVVPYWATWPFETLVLPRRHMGSFTDFTAAERTGLAAILKAVTTRYNNLFQVSFPYSLGFHQRPTDGRAHDSMHFHAHFYPPLLRSRRSASSWSASRCLAARSVTLRPKRGRAPARITGKALPRLSYCLSYSKGSKILELVRNCISK